MADIQAGKWTFCPNLLNRGSDFWNYIIVKTMLHEIHQQSYILPHMSQLNPKYFWIRLTSLENTLMLIFKHEVKIFSILFNFRTNGISHITFLEIWCRNNIILQKKIKKVKKNEKIKNIFGWKFIFFQNLFFFKCTIWYVIKCPNQNPLH